MYKTYSHKSSDDLHLNYSEIIAYLLTSYGQNIKYELLIFKIKFKSFHSEGDFLKHS